MTEHSSSPAGYTGQQTDLLSGKAVFTESYAVIPKSVMQDIVSSYLPFWTNTKAWILARPLTGFAETFSQYLVHVAPQGGSDTPETDPGAEAVIYLSAGTLEITLAGVKSTLTPGSYVYIAPGEQWQLKNNHSEQAAFHWIRKKYQSVQGIVQPQSFITKEANSPRNEMPNSNGTWFTQRFVAEDNLQHDMHVNIVTFKPGGCIPFMETHVMEHGLYVLEGKAVYKLNRDWVEVEAGDFLWLRAFCPQACYAGGPGEFRYLLYKDVNRHAALSLGIPS